MNVLCETLLGKEERDAEADDVLFGCTEEEADDWDECAELEERAEDEDDVQQWVEAEYTVEERELITWQRWSSHATKSRCAKLKTRKTQQL
jgi:hypothetical protein